MTVTQFSMQHDRIFFKRGTAARWAAKNPVLGQGEPGWDLTNGILKVGDGITPWNDLEPISGMGEQGPPGPPGPPGAGGLSMIQREFAIPSEHWEWEHNLDNPNLEINFYALDGITEIAALPDETTANRVSVRWFYPETGIIRILY